MAAAALEEALAQGVKDGKVPHAIVYATNKDGSFHYHHSTGFLHYGIDDEPIQDDSLILLASQSKLLTAVSALKLVEQQYIGLDDDVSPHLPELGSKKILSGFDENDQPILKDRKNPITLRQLLSHSSGDSYGMQPDIVKYGLTVKGANPMENIKPTIVERFDMPLAFEPGTSWLYSCGLDWTGLLIHRLTGLTLEEFEKKNFWDPMGIKGLSFWPSDERKKTKQAQLVIRTTEGKLAPHDKPTLNTFSTDCFGGHGIYADLGDYIQVLQSLLANDGKLLKPESVDELFKPQLGAASEQALNTFMKNWHTMIPGYLNPDVPTQYALGGILFLEDQPGMRKKGTMSWGGLFNPFWIVDRESGIAFTFGTQVLPPGDAGCKEMEALAERGVYKLAGLA